MPAVQETVEKVRSIDVDQYKYGFVTDLEVDKAPIGLNEDIVRLINNVAVAAERALDLGLGQRLTGLVFGVVVHQRELGYRGGRGRRRNSARCCGPR